MGRVGWGVGNGMEWNGMEWNGNGTEMERKWKESEGVRVTNVAYVELAQCPGEKYGVFSQQLKR